MLLHLIEVINNVYADHLFSLKICTNTIKYFVDTDTYQCMQVLQKHFLASHSFSKI